MRFDWDDAKAASNLRKHGVSFEEAEAVFADQNAIGWYDEEHSVTEERAVIIGMSSRLRVLYVVYTERDGDTIRIVSARRANSAEVHEYAKSLG